MAASDAGEPSIPTTTGAIAGVRHQWVLIVDDRDRAVRMVDETRADRSQQASADRAQSSAADDDHLGLLG